MKVNYKDAPKEKVGKGVYRIWLIDEKAGANNFFMRLFEMLPGTSTEEDSHPYEHEIFVVSGKGRIRIENQIERMNPGDAFFVPPDALHCIKNEGNKALKFICIVPASYRKYRKKGGT